MLDADGGFLERLARALEEGRENLAPEVLLVGSNLLGRDLARRIREKNGGWANLRIFTLIDLARRLAGNALDPSARLLGPQEKMALARHGLRKLGEGPEAAPLGILTARQGLPAALSALFDDFMDAGVEELPLEPPPAIGGERWRSLRKLYGEWRGRLGQGALHPAQAIALGAAHADRFGELLGCRRLWMAGFYDLTPNQESFIEALRLSGIAIIASLPRPAGRRGDFARPLEALLARIGAETIAAAEIESGTPRTALSRLKETLHADATASAAAPVPLSKGDDSLVVVSAPDEEREVREAAREIIRLAEEHGVSFERVAVTFPVGSRAAYLAIAEDVFPASGIPVAGHPFGNLAREPDGRALRALLSLLGLREIARHRILDLLSFEAPAAALTPGLPPGRIEKLSRLGGLAVWSGDWDRRLIAAARPRPFDESSDEEAPREDSGDEPAIDPALSGAIASLKGFFARLAGFPRRGSWEELLDALDGLARVSFPPLLVAGELRRIAESLRGLGHMEPETSIEAFRAAWEDELRRARPTPLAPASAGVRLGDLMELRGLAFDAVFILDVAEGSFPARPAVEPLLPDAARVALAHCGAHRGSRLAVKGTRIDEENLLFASSVASARLFLRLSFPRGSPHGGRRVMPSVFFLDAASLLAGKRLGGLDTEGIEAVCHRVDLAHGAHGVERSLDAAEFDVATAVEAAAGRRSPSAVREALSAANPEAVRLAGFEEAKWERKPRPADGLVRRELIERIPEALLFSRGAAITASKVETFARCPHRYLLQYVLGLQQVEDPEERFEIDARDRGLLGHRILELTYKAFQKEGLLPLEPGNLARAEEILLRVAGEECERSAARTAVGLPALWKLRRAELIDSLLGLLRDDAEEGGKWIPHRFEMRFSEADGALLELPRREGAKGPTPISFRGKIDRVDIRRGGGAVRVIDYKSGTRPTVGRKDPFAAGEMIQLPVYLLAASSRVARDLGPVEFGASHGVYRSFDGGQSVFPASSREELLGRLQRIAGEAAREIEAGEFFPTPRSGRKQCEYCPFHYVCDPRVESIAELKGFANRLGIDEEAKGGEGSDAEPDAAD